MVPASEIAQSESDQVQTTLGWSDCPTLARARSAARLRQPTSSRLLERALSVVEENARRTPLQADRAFSKLAEAAGEVGAEKIRTRAQARCQYFRSVRVAAAERASGGAPLLSVE